MSSSQVLPYGISLRDGGQIDIFPAAEGRVQNKAKEWLSLVLLIDSGAVVSALPRTDGEALGISVEKGVSTPITGIDGKEVRGWRHELGVKIGRSTLRIPVVFLDNPTGPRILGRADVFDRFTIVLDERRRRTGVLGEGSKEAGAVRKILDKTD